MQRFFIALLTFSSSFCFSYETIANAPVNPKTCNGEWTFTASGFYWNAHQDGLAFAIRNQVAIPVINPLPPDIEEINNLIDDDLETPKSKWEFGFKFAVGYNTSCDGWDLDLIWTHFSPSSFTHVSAELEDNQTLITLWSAFAPAQGEINFARDIEVIWKLDLDFVDFELGRSYWVSKRLSLRPFVGLRYVSIKQDYDLEHKGGSWSPRMNPPQDPFTNEVHLDNTYKGIGLRSGLNGVWNLECGWALYCDLSGNIIYGRFDVFHDENNRLAISPHTKTKLLDSRAHFRASRAIVDFALGIQWSALFCDCQYGVTAKLGWEQHLFFHQNQLWRVIRIGDEANGNRGENVYQQRRGNLDTEGWTLTLRFTF